MSSQGETRPSAHPEVGEAGDTNRFAVHVIDGTAKQCKGVIAGLQSAIEQVEDGVSVTALVGDVPSRIDVRAWAERKGHRVESERKEGSVYRIVVVKGGARAH